MSRFQSSATPPTLIRLEFSSAELRRNRIGRSAKFYGNSRIPGMNAVSRSGRPLLRPARLFGGGSPLSPFSQTGRWNTCWDGPQGWPDGLDDLERQAFRRSECPGQSAQNPDAGTERTACGVDAGQSSGDCSSALAAGRLIGKRAFFGRGTFDGDDSLSRVGQPP